MFNWFKGKKEEKKLPTDLKKILTNIRKELVNDVDKKMRKLEEILIEKLNINK